MATLVQVELHVSSVIESMCEDGDFCIDMWDELALGLSKGLLLDVTADCVQDWAIDNLDGAIRNLEYLVSVMKARRSDRLFLEGAKEVQP